MQKQQSVTIYSTLTASQSYCFYKEVHERAKPVIENKILIKGGANLADKHLFTPKGVPTIISNIEYEKLKDHPNFKTHLENGFIYVDMNNKSTIEKAIKNLEAKDNSAPKTYSDFPKERGEQRIEVGKCNG